MNSTTRGIEQGQIRANFDYQVNFEELLGREPVPPHQDLLEASIANRNVMVTGAGGSIGSELCRLIIALCPRRLVCFEMSEPALYWLYQELQKLSCKCSSEIEIIPLLGSVTDERHIRDVIQAFEINTVYHSAAYKHVPLVEQNLLQGIENNAFGTLHSARAAIDGGVDTFVLISTDKAVNPTSVMGASKRLSELILQALETRSTKTRFCAVRFGNVLGSSGSVIPLFLEQILSGGPITVTHRDAIRYFMTITEAAQLVIQAGAIADGADILVLDMGEPLRIYDLAHRMVSLLGLSVRDEEHPEGDIEIEFIGLRPAEKLIEERAIDNNARETEHPRIMRTTGDRIPYETLMNLLGELRKALVAGHRSHARDLLRQIVTDYTPGEVTFDLLISRIPEANPPAAHRDTERNEGSVKHRR